MAGGRNNHKDSASESESNTNTHTHTRHTTASSSSTTKTSQKARNQLALQQQQQYLAKHINSNGPQDRPKPAPLDFSTYKDSALLKYSERYGFHNLTRIDSLNSDILNSEIGKKTFSKRSKRRQRDTGRITKPEVANHIKNHFAGLPAKENDILTAFLYKVKNQDKEFKLTFQ
ncbi:Transcriptional regulatory protein SAP30 [Candida viswanathii]|uniref:Transcriptional regulatory protein SAP30 n=1 Tax=Candida viswanathii TaxID=5486 RepID=A0A367YG92_9ASCO|nr:Transcriptional regulatory protein SAP30 [Candida viswanathii]